MGNPWNSGYIVASGNLLVATEELKADGLEDAPVPSSSPQER